MCPLMIRVTAGFRIPLFVENVPANAIVSSVSIKFLIDHPHGEELTVKIDWARPYNQCHVMGL